jgi:CPA2 family monovalent cation:H+ antiporter-2
MSFDFNLLLESLPYIVLASLMLIAAKTTIILLLCRLFRFPLAPSIHAGLLLAQGGEFAFVVFLMVVQQRLMDVDLAQFLMTVVTFTMALTPMLAIIGRRIKSYLYIAEVLRDNKLKREIGEIGKHVVIIGFSMVGRIVAYILRKRDVKYIILENNHRIVSLEQKNGYSIYYGDAMNADILRYIGVERAESVVVAMEDEVACMKITRFIHENFSHATVITKTETINNVDRFKRVGATHVVSKNIETGLQLTRAALASIGVGNLEIINSLDSFREINPEIIKEIISTEGETVKQKHLTKIKEIDDSQN